MPRPDGRAPEELRPISFERDFTEMADGSCLVSFGGRSCRRRTVSLSENEKAPCGRHARLEQ